MNLSLSHWATHGSQLYHLFLSSDALDASVPCFVGGGRGGRKGPKRANPEGKTQSFLSLFVWFNIMLVYPWMNAKTFEFRAKEQVTATYGFNKDQPVRESAFKCTWLQLFRTHTQENKIKNCTHYTKWQSHKTQSETGNWWGWLLEIIKWHWERKQPPPCGRCTENSKGPFLPQTEAEKPVSV